MNNFCIILAGGIGSRLWPYSREKQPKQFLDLLGIGRTMLQLTFDRFNNFLPSENIYVSTFEDYKDLVLEQLPEINPEHVIAEPVQLGTAPATTLTLCYIMQENPDANVIVSPADQIVIRDDDFRQKVKNGFTFVENNDTFLVLGVKATSPDTLYGYLQAGEQTKDGFSVLKSFTEKPPLDFARFFVDSGEFYWSTGLFMGNVKTFLDLLIKTYPDAKGFSAILNGEKSKKEIDAYVQDNFPRNRFQSLDLVILEQNSNVCICPCSFGWRDMGSWEGYYLISQKDGHGNVVKNARTTFYNSHNNVIMTSPGKIVLASDIDNFLIIENGDIIMICKRDDMAQVRHMMTDSKMKYGETVS